MHSNYLKIVKKLNILYMIYKMNKLLNSRFLSRKELMSLNFKKIGENVLIDKNVFIPNTNNIEIGNNVRIDMGSIISVPKNGEIIIKNNVHIAPYNLIY